MPVATAEWPASVPYATLPVIDAKKLEDPEELDRLSQACRSLGFFSLINHDLDPWPIFDIADAFMNLPDEVKDKYNMGTDGNYFGYKRMGQMITDYKGTPDKNEFFNIGKDDMFGFSNGREQPPVIRDHLEELKAYTLRCHAMVTRILTAIATILQIPEEAGGTGYLASKHRFDYVSGDMIRMIKAPPRELSDTELSMGAHTDFGSVTLLFNNIGGLQVLEPGKQEWSYVRPLPNSCTVNLGDALAYMTNGLFRSNIHRVVQPPAEQSVLTRFSIVYFSRPENDTILQPIDCSPLITAETDDQNTAHAEPITAGQWIKHRVLYGMKANEKDGVAWKRAQANQRIRVV